MCRDHLKPYRAALAVLTLAALAFGAGDASAASPAGPFSTLSQLGSLRATPIYVETVSHQTFRCELVDATDDGIVVRVNGVSRVVPARDIESVFVQARRTKEGLIVGAAIGAVLAALSTRLDGCIAKGCGAGLAIVPALGAAIGGWWGARLPKDVIVYRRPQNP